MGAAGLHPLRLGPALWKFALRQRRTIVHLYLPCPAAIPVAYRDGRSGQAGILACAGFDWKWILKRRKAVNPFLRLADFTD